MRLLQWLDADRAACLCRVALQTGAWGVCAILHAGYLILQMTGSRSHIRYMQQWYVRPAAWGHDGHKTCL